MSNEVKNLITESNTQVMELALKGGVGATGTIITISINDWAGLIVAILTGIYMCFQIEAAWRNRKAAKIRQKKMKDE